MKFIQDKELDYENQVFVQCACGNEVIEFCKDINDFDHSVEYFILPFLQNNNKKDKFCAFTFENKGDFSALLDELRCFINGVSKPDCTVLFDKYLSYKNKFPGVLVVSYSEMEDKENVFIIRKYIDAKEPSRKRGKFSWEVVLTKEQSIELLAELENWN